MNTYLSKSSRTARRFRTKAAGALASLVLATAALAGCSSGSDADSDSGSSSGSSGTSGAAAAVDGGQDAAAVLAANKESHAKDSDAEWDESDAVAIELDGDSASADGDGVTVKGATVTITGGGTYRISGTLSDGQIVVNAPDQKVKLVLDGAKISHSSGAAIDVTEADEAVVILADGSENTLGDADSYADDAEANAALYSAADLTVTGEGKLTVRGNGNDGIAGTDGLVIASGTVVVDAVDDGIRGKDYLIVEGGAVTVTAGGDGLKADNSEDKDSGYVAVGGGTVKVTAKGDGVDAATDLVATGGSLTVESGGGSGTQPSDDASTKGLKAGVINVLEGGTVSVDASDDAVHSDGAVHVNGAKVTAASGDDGTHAEGDLTVDKGTLKITSAVEGVEGADISVNGGTVEIRSSDDGINAAGGTGTSDAGGGGGGGGFGGGPGGGGGGEDVGDFKLTVSGGTLVVDSEGDGLDSNGTAEITGGTVVVNGPQQGGNGALDVNGDFGISGGLLLAAGSAGMAVAPSADSEQGWLSATLDAAVPAGTTLHVVDSDGKVVATYVTSKSIQNVVHSSSAVKKGEEYAIYSGGTKSGTSTGGLASSGSLGSAERIATVTAGEAPEGGFGGGGRRP
ncbi:carbohydrate-binding domain-containing protein [Streptomyces sp. NBC_00878]|uniref:carbohydrate-binding domain-containing protein n=1 Tax=Streptomyces sp. NBC_00878 TaxID=2975854 RepID=UPI00224CA088|nr:carbohydrate-binding domain-containing protein [Streptomyces sp. NBC_00878]MCX4907264.1 carbohydrate-binding domain-containing protein [Streptomyces sp. NBC_00878]